MLFIHHGIYAEGVFKFVMTIPENYPDGDCPVCNINLILPVFRGLFYEVIHSQSSIFILQLMKFVPPVYHPLINFETGEVNVKQAFPSWRFANFSSAKFLVL